MKMFYLLILSLAVVCNAAYAAKKSIKVACPKVIGNLAKGEFSASKNNYKCYKNAKAAKDDGLVQASPSFGSRTFSGTTDQSTAIFATSRPAQVTYSYVGKEHFAIVYRHSADGKYGGLLANDVVSISGSKSIPEAGVYYFDVSGVGQWTITVTPK